jgi:ATP-dependent helicase/nuclease subunit A
MIPDAAQRKRALDPRESFIVQAPAGSGKTELLIQRYLTLLARVEEPESVVAITFTKKAAGEMRRRVLDALRDSAGPRPAQEHAAATWELARAARRQSDDLRWELSGNPNRLRIRTIDSLCSALTRQMPWLSRLGAPPAIAEEPADLYAEAARRTIELLESGAWSDAVAALLSRLDNDFQKLQTLLAAMLARRDQWLRHVAGAKDDPERARDALESALANLIRDTIGRAIALVPAGVGDELAALAARAGANLQAEGLPGAAVACVDLTRMPGPDGLDPWLGIVEMLLTKDGKWRGRPDKRNGFPTSDKPLKARLLSVIAALSSNEPLRAALAEIRLMPDAHYAPDQWQAIQALVELLPMAVAQLQVRFREGGEADYTEVAMAAQRALGEPEEPTDLALAMDCRIQHLLVDEFQDTSVGQYGLIARLTAGWQPGDGRTLFVVGDPMQSIYRFREAEVGLFLKACEEGIGAIPLKLLRLSANFRSVAGLVDWVNQTFESVFPARQDITTGAIPFSRSESVKPEGAGAAVTLHPFLGHDDAAEAARVVEIIQAARARGAETAAILVRSRRHLESVIPALRAAGLRYRAVDIDPLSGLPLIADLTALVRALLHPADRAAWLAVLRAPWCGLTLEDLHSLVGGDPHSAVWDLLRDPIRLAVLNADARARLARAASALGRALSCHPPSLRVWVESTWLALGGPACSPDPAALENANAFFALLESMDDGGRLDLGAFSSRIAHLFANPDPEAGEELQVMTIHKAKGLQFDLVIVPGLGRGARSEESRLLRWLERPRLGGGVDLLLAPIHAEGAEPGRAYDYLKHVDSEKSTYEAGRLLYVAATRAKSELHLLAHVEAGEEAGVVKLKLPTGNSLLKRMWSAAAPVFEEAARHAAPPAPTVPALRVPQAIERLTLAWRLPAPPEAVNAPAPAAETAGDAVSFEWVGDTLRHVGTAAHQMLRRIAEDGLEQWDAGRVEDRRASFRSVLSTLGVPAADLDSAVDRVLQAVTRALEDGRGRWLFDPTHTASACEYAISGAVGDEIVNVRVDRTFVDREGVRWIIDYKTSSHEGAGLDAFLDSERERYRAQLEGYRRLFAALEDRPVRAALYFPLLGAWRELREGAAAGE